MNLVQRLFLRTNEKNDYEFLFLIMMQFEIIDIVISF